MTSVPMCSSILSFRDFSFPGFTRSGRRKPSDRKRVPEAEVNGRQGKGSNEPCSELARTEARSHLSYLWNNTHYVWSIFSWIQRPEYVILGGPMGGIIYRERREIDTPAINKREQIRYDLEAFQRSSPPPRSATSGSGNIVLEGTNIGISFFPLQQGNSLWWRNP